MVNKVIRYDFIAYEEVYKASDGPWVKFRDHDAIVAKLTRALEIAVAQRNYWIKECGDGFIAGLTIVANDAEIIKALGECVEGEGE